MIGNRRCFEVNVVCPLLSLGISENRAVPIHLSGLKPVLILCITKLLKLFHRHVVPMHDCDEVPEVRLGEALGLDVKKATINAFYARDFLSPSKE